MTIDMAKHTAALRICGPLPNQHCIGVISPVSARCHKLKLSHRPRKKTRTISINLTEVVQVARELTAMLVCVEHARQLDISDLMPTPLKLVALPACCTPVDDCCARQSDYNNERYS
jgi:hypothetical protein